MITKSQPSKINNSFTPSFSVPTLDLSYNLFITTICFSKSVSKQGNTLWLVGKFLDFLQAIDFLSLFSFLQFNLLKKSHCSVKYLNISTFFSIASPNIFLYQPPFSYIDRFMESLVWYWFSSQGGGQEHFKYSVYTSIRRDMMSGCLSFCKVDIDNHCLNQIFY